MRTFEVRFCALISRGAVLGGNGWRPRKSIVFGRFNFKTYISVYKRTLLSINHLKCIDSRKDKFKWRVRSISGSDFWRPGRSCAVEWWFLNLILIWYLQYINSMYAICHACFNSLIYVETDYIFNCTCCIFDTFHTTKLPHTFPL